LTATVFLNRSPESLATPAEISAPARSVPLPHQGLLLNVATLSIQQRINLACNGTNPATAWMPLGITNNIPALHVPSNCIVACPSKRQCRLNAAANLGTDFVIIKGKANVALWGLVLDGNAAHQTKGSCIHVVSSNNVRVDSSEITNCRNHGVWFDGVSDLVVAVRNFIHGTQAGSGILAGNTPVSQGGANTQITNFHFNSNQIRDIRGMADGIFTLGNQGSGYGTGKGEIVGNTIGPNIADTGIEIGVASHDVTVTGNAINMAGGSKGGVGLSVRSASKVAATFNKIKGSSVIPLQVCLLAWNNAGKDPTTVLNLTMDHNTATGCTHANTGPSTQGFDLQLNLGKAGISGAGDHMKLTNTLTDGGPKHYNYLTFPKDFYRCVNDDGGFCSATAVTVALPQKPR
jgi:hypothetical protein